MIDSSDFSVIQAAMEEIQGRCIINSISLKEGEAVFLDHAREIQRFGHAMVVMLFDEQGQADTLERKIACARRSCDLLFGAGIRPEDIIIDPNVLAIATGVPEHDGYARDFIQAVAWIHQHIPQVHVSGGVSNLSFAFRGNNAIRGAMHSVFLDLSGLDMAIINPGMDRDVSISARRNGRSSQGASHRDHASGEALIAFAGVMVPSGSPVKTKTEVEAWKSLPPKNDSQAVVHGDDSCSPRTWPHWMARIRFPWWKVR
jgi:cobalamin-dependent methionine synthase I